MVNDFVGVDYFWIGLVLLAFIISNISRAVRWLILLRPLGYQPRMINAFLSIMIGYFANLGLPRMGEVARAGTLARYERIGLEKVMGTIVVDRIFDVISILLLTALALALEFDAILDFAKKNVHIENPFSGSAYPYWLAGLILASIAGLFIAYRRKLKQSRIYLRITQIAKGFVEGLQTLRRIDKVGWFAFHSVNIWLMYFLMTYLCFFAFEPTSGLPPVAGLTVFIFGAWGIVIPSPGGMGTYHFLAQTALGIYGIEGDDGFSWANISFFSIQLGINVLVGILSLLFLPLINRNYQPDDDEQHTNPEREDQRPHRRSETGA